MALSIEAVLLGASALVLLSIFAGNFSTRFGIPALLIFLAVGMLAGSDGPGGIYFDNPWAAKTLGVAALILILFSGGLDTDWKSIRHVLGPGVVLSTAGVLITALSVGMFCKLVLGFSWLHGMLLGAIVSSTDAAAVFSVLKSKSVSLKRYVQPLLEFESGSNDPMAVFLTIALIQLINRPDTGLVYLIGWFFWQMTLGAVIGVLMGRLMVWAVNRSKLEYEGLYPVLTLSLVLFTYGFCSLLQGNGFLAVYICGLVLSSKDFFYKKSLLRFHDGLAWLMQIAMFVTLGLLVYPSRLMPVAGIGLAVSLFLMFAARPLSVFASLAPFRLKLNEKLMVSWVGLRGAVPVVLSTFPLLEGVPGADLIFNIVFFVVLTSVLLQGTSIPIIAKWLRVDAPLQRKLRSPIEFEPTQGVDTELVEFMVPFNAWAAGKAIQRLSLPPDCLIILVCRGEKFILATGKTALEEGDVVLCLVNEQSAKEVQSVLSRQK